MNTLDSISLKNFQSLEEVTFPVGNFTAIVGPSNLGKSAIIRAVRALARNAAAPGLVRMGEKQFVASAAFSDGTTETLTKGSKVSHFDVAYADGKAITHAKAGATAVPDEVENLWSIPDFCFTTQHDKPFLLAESPSEVAKVLGDLTNASMLMEAVREANRQRTEALNQAKAFQREADECRAEILTHTGFNARVDALDDARLLLDEAKTVAYKKQQLEEMLHAHANNQEQLATSQVAVKDDALVTELVTKASELTAKYQQLVKIVSYKQLVTLELSKTQEVATKNNILRSEIEAEIHNVMSEAGVCPLCNQGVA